MREYEEGYPVDANDRWKQGFYPDPERRNSSNFGFASVKRDAVPGGNKAREDATDYLNERLKVMPYESTEVLFDQRVELHVMDDSTGSWQMEQALPISAGDSVKVTFDGVAYILEAFAIEGMDGNVLFGNGAIAGMEDNGIPFLIITGVLEGIEITNVIGDAGTHSVRIEGTVIHTIDPKFIPAGVGGGGIEIVTISGSSSAGYSADKTFADIVSAIYAGKVVYALYEQKLLPLIGNYRIDEVASGVMTADAQPDPEVTFGGAMLYVSSAVWRYVKINSSDNVTIASATITTTE